MELVEVLSGKFAQFIIDLALEHGDPLNDRVRIQNWTVKDGITHKPYL